VEVFRISRDKYATGLFASGIANRWNKRDEFVIYTCSSRALCSLEYMVHTNAITPAGLYKAMVITIADKAGISEEISLKMLPKDWRKTSAYPLLQDIGSKWYQAQKSLLLQVPSAIIPEEYNYIINTKHPDFKKHVKLTRTEDYIWDDRLIIRPK
jgi:RES domain-containing protein